MNEELRKALKDAGATDGQIQEFEKRPDDKKGNVNELQALLDAGDMDAFDDFVENQKDPSAATNWVPEDQDDDDPNTVAGEVSEHLAAFLVGIGQVQVDPNVGAGEDPYSFMEGALDVYLDNVNKYSREIGDPQNFTRDTLAQANQWIAEIGLTKRNEFIAASYPTGRKALEVTMNDGTVKIIPANELAQIQSVIGADEGMIGAAARAATGGITMHAILLAHMERSKAGIAGTVEHTAVLVREGYKLYGGRDLFAYMHAAESVSMDPESRRAGKAPETTLAETLFTAPQNMTADQKRLRDDLLGPYVRLAQSSADFNPDSADYQTAGLLEVSDRTPETPYDEGATRQKFRELHEALFGETPDEKTLNSFQAKFESDLNDWASRPAAVSVPWIGQTRGDVYARPTPDSSARGFLQSTDLYQDVFGEEFQGSGMSAEDYAAQFHNRAATQFEDPTNQRMAARAGMRSGDIADVTRYGLTAEGREDQGAKSRFAVMSEVMRNL